jgi:hypothetical protein
MLQQLWDVFARLASEFVVIPDTGAPCAFPGCDCRDFEEAA